jgi:ribonuclease III
MTNIRYNWNEAYNKFMNTRFIEIRKKLSLKDSTSEINPEIINKALIPYIENEKNRVITIPKINEIVRNLTSCKDYETKFLSNFIIATTHKTYIEKDRISLKEFKEFNMGINLMGGDELKPKPNNVDAVKLQKIPYERLEFVGDSIIRLVLSDYLSIRYDSMQEGDLTKLRAKLENGTALAEMTRKLGLNNYILISRNLELINARVNNEKLQCDVFEAFIAALYYDVIGVEYNKIGKDSNYTNLNRSDGYDICRELLISLIEEEIDLGQLLLTDLNYKDMLLQHFHKMNWKDPSYNLYESWPDPNRMNKEYFKMIVRDNENKIIGIGVGPSKQKGEKKAAEMALITLGVIIKNDQEYENVMNKNIINFDNNYNKFKHYSSEKDIPEYESETSSEEDNNISMSSEEDNNVFHSSKISDEDDITDSDSSQYKEVTSKKNKKNNKSNKSSFKFRVF